MAKRTMVSFKKKSIDTSNSRMPSLRSNSLYTKWLFQQRCYL